MAKKNRQHNGQEKKYKRTNKQRSTKHTYKTKDQVTRTPQKTGGELRLKGYVCQASTYGLVLNVDYKTKQIIVIFTISSYSTRTFRSRLLH